ncbi:hypothetical protein BU24DRAFT_477241 [Aaosphaeria arxii CBS 175.79]|uniref:Uncharacterized protein n=1 Tax=Aaosphaeria arxii CBS 175.79 TaxID=1450172 RepID=A0A6A5Y5I0_9PLEO|nr:uncharacterized protein BU24DRAFT_477241 [Aaosphaeria arxii CBS 175.79]KAF2020101.1 hypothetical protein BU24DRAFT_477241 [Aaosphaeria arxii CBS 175.79]
MSFHLKLLLRFLLLNFPLLSLCKRMDSSFPYAITLGPSRIFASRATQNGEVEVFPFNPGHGYTTYLDGVIQHYAREPSKQSPRNEHAALPIIRDAINNISKELSATLGYEPVYRALLLPTLFDDSSSGAAIDVLFPNGTALAPGGPNHVTDVAGAAGYAYHLDQCENLGLSPSECTKINLLPKFLLVVEYEHDYLHLHLASVDVRHQLFPIIRSQHFETFGEGSRDRLSQSLGMKRYRAHLSDSIKNFIKTGGGHLYRPFKAEHIRAIVGFGDAPGEAFTELLNITYEAVGNERAKIMSGIDPAYVAAYGAAMFARETVLKPERWRVHGAHLEL